MTIPNLFTRVKTTVSGAPGTGVITLGSAVAGFVTPASAGVGTGSTVSYVIEDGTNFEAGYAEYTASGTLLTRFFVVASSTLDGNGTPTFINATSAAVVYFTALPQDLVNPATLIAVVQGSWALPDNQTPQAQGPTTNVSKIERLSAGSYRVTFVNPISLNACPAAAATVSVPTGQAASVVEWGWAAADDYNFVNSITMRFYRWDTNLVDPSNIRLTIMDRADAAPKIIVAPQTYSTYRITPIHSALNAGASWQIAELILSDVNGTAQTPTGITTSDFSTIGGTSYPASNMIDGNPATFWQSANGINEPQEIILNYATAFQINRIDVTTPNISSGQYGAPIEFNLYGSNDGGTTWVRLSNSYKLPNLSSAPQGSTASLILNTSANPKIVPLNDTTTAYSQYRFKLLDNADMHATTPTYPGLFLLGSILCYDKDGNKRPAVSAASNNTRASSSFDPGFVCVGSPYFIGNSWRNDSTKTGDVLFDLFFNGAFVINAVAVGCDNNIVCPTSMDVYGSHDGITFTYIGRMTIPYNSYMTSGQVLIWNLWGGTSPSGTAADPNAPPVTSPTTDPTKGTGHAVNGHDLPYYPSFSPSVIFYF